jgi:hypothetical protein
VVAIIYIEREKKRANELILGTVGSENRVFFTYRIYMPRKISNSAVYDTEEERRPVAVNKRQFRPKPIPIDKAGLALELLNNQTRPIVNIVGTRHFHEDPTPLDKNYPIEIELQRIAMSAVPDKPQQPLKTKSPFTEEMIEKYREEERRGILQRGYNVPPDLEVLDLQPEVVIPDAYKNYEQTLRRMTSSMVEATLLYDRAKKNVPIVMKQLKDLDDKYNSLISDPKRRVRVVGESKIYLEDEYIKQKQQLEQYLDTLQTDMRNLQEEIQMTQTDMEQMKQDKKDLLAQETNVKRANAQKIKNAEDQIRLLNTTLPIQQMVGEPDEVYRQRLIALRVPVDNSRVDATEARIYEHKLFKRNLKKLIDLPLYQVENIIKMLDLNDMERTYQLNEIFPKVETEFIKVFGRKPLLRDPVQSLTDFFISIVEAPLLAQEQTEAISALAEEQSVYTGDIDRSLIGLKKAEVLKLIKDAGISKGRAQLFQKMTVKQLKIIYTEHLKKTRSETEQARSEAFGFLSQLGQSRIPIEQGKKKFMKERLIARVIEEEERQAKEDRESEKLLKQQDKARRKQEREMMAEEEKQTRMIIKEQQRQEAEYNKLLEAQRREEARKQKGIGKFMVAKKK